MKTAPPPQVVERADGVRLYLADGRELIDGIASWWTACHGYNHPHIRAAVAAQLERMPHVMLGGLVHAPAVELAARLAAALPGDLEHVFFTESGSVAVEVAMKIALQYRFNRDSVKNTCSSSPGNNAASRAANSTAGACTSPPSITCGMRSSCAATAARMCGWL